MPSGRSRVRARVSADDRTRARAGVLEGMGVLTSAVGLPPAIRGAAQPGDKSGTVGRADAGHRVVALGGYLRGVGALLCVEHVDARACPAAGEPPYQLKGFQKVTLAPGQSQRITLQLTSQDLSYYRTATSSWVVAPGRYRVSIGGNERDLAVSALFYRH